MFIDFLNNVWVGKIDDDVEKSFKGRFIHESDCNNSKDPLHMLTEIETAKE